MSRVSCPASLAPRHFQAHDQPSPTVRPSRRSDWDHEAIDLSSAHLAPYDDPIREKYQLASLIGTPPARNTYLDTPMAARSPATDFEDPSRAFSPANNSVSVLQCRGVFPACHDAIWEFSASLIAKGRNPDKLSHEQLAAELTNHLIPGAVLTPGVVGTIPELQSAGYHYIQ